MIGNIIILKDGLFMEKKENVLKWGVLVSYIIMLVVNVLAGALPLNGITTGEISQKYESLFTPAGYTFMIWIVIYALLALYIMYLFGVFKKFKPDPSQLSVVNFYFIILNVLNALWLFSWHYELLLLSVVILFLMLACLIIINLNIAKLDLDEGQTLFVKTPFAIYMAWITIACIAGVATLLVSLGWNGFGISDSVWTVIVLLVAIVISVAATINLNSAAYALTILWALAGILVQQLTFYNGIYTNIIITVIIGMIAMVASIGYLIYKNTKKIS